MRKELNSWRSMKVLRKIPDGKPFRKGERGWYKLDGCEHWMIFESAMDGNRTTPATAPLIWKHIREEEENGIKWN